MTESGRPGSAVLATAAMTQSPYTFDVVSDPAGLRGLARDWERLYERQASPHLSDSFGWALLSWESVAAPLGRRLHCLVVRRGSRPAAIWPLVVAAAPFARIASPLNSEGSEYCPCLLDPEEQPEALGRAVGEGLASLGQADALRLPHVRRDGPLEGLLVRLPGACATIVQPAPMVRAAAFADPDHYASQLSSNTRGALRRRRRKLEQIGRVEFVDVVEAAERADLLHWALSRKRSWLKDRGLANARLFSESHAAFLEATLRHPWASGSRRVFALKLDGVPIAAEIASVDGRRVEAFNSTFDAALAAYAPGHLLTLEVIRWALGRGLDYDFRPGTEAYKLTWASEVVPVTSYLVPLTFRGRQFVRYRLARRWLAERTPAPLRRRLARLGAPK